MSLSLYVHIPFCQRKCPYCDFNTYAGLNRLYEPFTAALVQEIGWAGAVRGRPPVKTLFLGGGTPTVLPVALLAGIMDACRAAFDLLPGAEITSEANPGTVDVTRFAALRGLGVNRLSMGVQSFDQAELAFLGRIHSAEEAVKAVAAARAAGFDNINLDFIYGLPGQSPATWRSTLDQAIALAPEHISLYSLTIEDGTPFGDWAAAGQLAQPSPDLAADLYEIADALLASAGYVQYEISNWAKSDPATDLPAAPRFACQHNLTYWRNEPYLGFGPGAHSSEQGQRWAAIRPVPEYIQRVNAQSTVADPPSRAVADLPSLAVANLPSLAVAGLRPSHAPPPWVDFVEQIDDRLAMGETMMLGLRLVQEGVTYDRFQRRHGLSMLDVFSAEIERLERLGLLERLPDRVRLAQEARLVGNQVFAAFLP